MATYIVGDLKEELEADADVQEILGQFAQDALPIAQALAARITHTGAFSESLSVDGARLETDDPGGLSIEYGTADTPPQAVLRRAAEGAGALIDEGAASSNETKGRRVRTREGELRYGLPIGSLIPPGSG